MKNLIVNYRVFSNKICDKKIVLISDLHDYKTNNIKTLIEDIKKENADYIVIAGDIFNTAQYLKDSARLKDFNYFLSSISESSPVFLGLGNHDIFCEDEDTQHIYKELKNIRVGKIFPLSNETMEYDNIRFVEFHPRHSAFSPSIQDSGRALLEFNKDFDNSGIVIPEKDAFYNIMISHNPKIFDQARSVHKFLKIDITQEEFDNLMELSKKLSAVDLCLSGHLHNGYIPLSKTIKNPSKYIDEGYLEMPLEKDIHGLIKTVRPKIFKKTDMCRGTIFSGGIEQRVIELSNGSFYYKYDNSVPLEISQEQALEYIDKYNLSPIVVSGGINKYFNLPIDNGEITTVKILKK